MPARSYGEYEVNDADNQLGSPPLRFPEGWAGSAVNGAMAALASAVRNLGDKAAKLPLEDGAVVLGPNSGRVGTAAFQDENSFTLPDSSPLGARARKVVGADLRIFYGSIEDAAAEAEYGWAICDGRTVNGVTTPDLRERFLMNFSTTLDPLTTGGSTTRTTSEGGGHAHAATAAGATLGSSQVPTHSTTTSTAGSGGAVTVVTGVSHTALAASSHTHTITVADAADHTHTVTNLRPPYVVVVYLMWVGVS